MMFTKSTLLVTIFAVAQVAVATPPACLLAAVNTYSDPADLSAVCKSSDVQSELKSACASDYSTALAAFKEVCKGAGVNVSGPSPTTSKATKSSKPTSTSKGSGGSVSHATPRPSGSMTTKASGKPTGSATSTGKTNVVTKSSIKASGTSGGTLSSAAPYPSSAAPYPSMPVGSNSTMTGSMTTGSPTAAPSNAAGHLEAGAYLAMAAAGLVAFY